MRTWHPAQGRVTGEHDGIVWGYAKEKGVKYFLIAFVDLFGTMRAKIVPATAIDTIAKSGAGFAGLCDLARHDAGASGHAGDARSPTR